jgi:hypothetical protein
VKLNSIKIVLANDGRNIISIVAASSHVGIEGRSKRMDEVDAIIKKQAAQEGRAWIIDTQDIPTHMG